MNNATKNIGDFFKQVQFMQLAKLFYRSTNIPVLILDSNSEVITEIGFDTKFYMNHSIIIDFFRNINKNLKYDLDNKFNIETFNNTLYSAFMPVSVGEKHAATCIFGPIRLSDNFDNKSAAMFDIPIENQKDFYSEIENIPVMETDKALEILERSGIVRMLRRIHQTNVALEEKDEQYHWAQDVYEALVDLSLYGIIIIQNKEIIFANKRFSELTGYPPNEIQAKKGTLLDDLLKPLRYDDILEKYINLYNSAETLTKIDHADFSIYKKNGEIMYVEAKLIKITFRNQPAMQVSFIDITERKLREIRVGILEKEVEFLHNIQCKKYVNFLYDGVIVHNKLFDRLNNLFDFKNGVKSKEISELLTEMRNNSTQIIDIQKNIFDMDNLNAIAFCSKELPEKSSLYIFRNE